MAFLNARRTLSRFLLRPTNFRSTKPINFPSSPLSDPQSRVPTSEIWNILGFNGGVCRSFVSENVVHELLAEVEREWEERRRRGEKLDDNEEEEDIMGLGPLIKKLEGKGVKDEKEFDGFEERTESDSSDDDDGYSPEECNKGADAFDKKFKKHEEMIRNLEAEETFDTAFKWINKIDKFEKHLALPLEYRVIGELLNRLKEATNRKERLVLIQKLNRAIQIVEWKEADDPNKPANYGVIQHEQVEPSVDLLEHAVFEKEKQMIQGGGKDDDDDFIEDKDDVLLERLNAIDRKIEQMLSELDHTFGKKGKVIEEEIRDLAEERNTLTEKKRRPLYRKGFDVKLIDVNRTCKVTKGGQVIKYTALLACGNYHGVIGFAEAKGPAVPIALQKAYEKCFQNLHYVERYEGHTIPHAIQTNYKKTKIYLWPASTTTGMKAGRTVETILHLAGYKNVKSKVIGSRNPHNTLKAVFRALTMIETPKDVQEKFG